MIGFTTPEASSGHTCVRSAAAIRPFSAGVRGRSVEPVIHARLRIMIGEVELGAGVLQKRDLQQPAFDRQQLDVAGM